jgi:hypothetical protein
VSEATALMVMVALLLVVMVALPQILLRRAVPSLIRIFRERGAVGADNAKTPAELGIQQTTFTQTLFRGRDDKASALEALKEARVVQSTQDGKLYLSEDRLAASKWKGR